GASYQTMVCPLGTVAVAVNICTGLSAHAVWSPPLTGASGTDGKPEVAAELFVRSASSVSVEISAVLTRSSSISSDGLTVTSYLTAAPLGNNRIVSSSTSEPDVAGKNTVPEITSAVQSTNVAPAGTTSCILTPSA